MFYTILILNLIIIIMLVNCFKHKTIIKKCDGIYRLSTILKSTTTDDDVITNKNNNDIFNKIGAASIAQAAVVAATGITF